VTERAVVDLDRGLCLLSRRHAPCPVGKGARCQVPTLTTTARSATDPPRLLQALTLQTIRLGQRPRVKDAAGRAVRRKSADQEEHIGADAG
jgi:hypothetical protein